MTPREYIDYIDSYRNQDIVMPLSEEGYSLGELKDQVIPTTVKLVGYLTDNETGRPKNTLATGNVYDIDDKYVYILTCEHWAHNDSSSECYTFNYVKCTFNDISNVDVKAESVFFDDHIDIGLIRVDRSALNASTLASLRSINYKDAYNIVDDENINDTLKNINLYCWKLEKFQYNRFGIYGLEYTQHSGKKGVVSVGTTIEGGCSGGGVFDIHGNYWGEIIKSSMTFPCHIYRIEDLLLKANPNYFN